MSEAHLRRVLSEYVEYFNHARPHQGISQRIPEAAGGVGQAVRIKGTIVAFPVLGGLHHD